MEGTAFLGLLMGVIPTGIDVASYRSQETGAVERKV